MGSQRHANVLLFAGKYEADIELAIHSIFDSVIVISAHPRTVINVNIQIIHDDGSLLSAVINCVTLALVDAGIPIHGLISSVSCGFEGRAGLRPAQPAIANTTENSEGEQNMAASTEPLFDLLPSEEGHCRVAGTYAFKGLTARSGPVFVRQNGSGSWGETAALLDGAAVACSTVLAFLRMAIQRKVGQDAVNFGGAAGVR